MKFNKLFESGKIGKMEIRNRIVQVPMVLNYTEYPYNITRRYIDALEERARGGVGLIVTCHIKGESSIDPYPIANMFPCLDREYTLKTFADLTDAVHMHGAKIAAQLSPGTGRHADVPMADNWPASASVVPMVFHPQLLTRELSLDEIARLVEAYGETAGRAERAGFDAILFQFFCGYLADQFLTPLWNKRTDKYGGDLENRMRFMVECVESVKSKVSADFPLIARINSNHMMEGGRSLDETIKIAKRLEELGISALHLSIGCYDVLDWVTPPMYYPDAAGVPYAQPIKETVNIPIIVDGKISSPELAEKLLEEGKTDFIGLGRPLLADPWWPRKAREGRTDEIRRCIYCNECINEISVFKHAKCSINPALGKEKEYKLCPATKSKKVIVIGGGPAGMQAAVVAALRGHNVTLWEKGYALGGNMRLASVPDFKRSYRRLINYLSAQIKNLGVTVKFGKEATPEAVQEVKPDAVILATGGIPFHPEIPGKDGYNVISSLDLSKMCNGLLKWNTINKKGWQKIIWFGGNIFARFLKPSTIAWLTRFWLPIGKRVIIIGGSSHAGCEMALFLAQKGRKVTIVEMLPEIATDLGVCEKIAMIKLLRENKVSWSTNMKLDEITKEGVVATDKDGRKQAFKADTVVLTGMKTDDKLYKELEGKVPELYKIGDALEPRKIFNCIHEGDFVAREI